MCLKPASTYTEYMNMYIVSVPTDIVILYMCFQLTGNDIYFGIQKALMGDEEDAYLGLGKFF